MEWSFKTQCESTASNRGGVHPKLSDVWVGIGKGKVSYLCLKMLFAVSFLVKIILSEERMLRGTFLFACEYSPLPNQARLGEGNWRIIFSFSGRLMESVGQILFLCNTLLTCGSRQGGK